MVDTDIGKYKHKFDIRVRNFETDSQGIVHNAIYLEYCEIGRVEYVRHLGFHLLPTGVFDNNLKINVKLNEIAYDAPATLDEIVEVHTRISYVKNSSFCFEHLLVNKESRTMYCRQKSVQVNLNTETNRPERLPDGVRRIISEFEGDNVRFYE